MATFRLQIVTPSQILFDGEVESLVAPGRNGYFGVLPHHAPLVAALGPGTLRVRKKDRTEFTHSLAGGFLEVSNNEAVLLAQTPESPD